MKLSILSEQVTNKKQSLDKLIDRNLLRLNSLYKQNGHELRIVGGAVRDILMDKEPKDIDLATDATPDESMELLKANDIKVIETGLQHGTVVAHIDGEDYEITTLRIDTETDGRHAKVEYTKDWEQDAERRDLTFNAMSMDFDGNLYDYHGGHEDLKSGTARFVGDADSRMQEDFLRILRYFRFQGRTESPSFDKDTLAKIAKNAEGLKQISGERIWMEMAKVLSGNHAPLILSKMKSSGVMDNIGLPNANLNEFKRVYNNTKNSNLLMASLLGSVEDLDTVRSRWKFSNPEYEMMKVVLQHRDKNLSLTAAKRMNVMLRVKKNLIVSLLEYNGNHEAATKLKNWEAPEFPVGGQDLKGLGIEPGPEFGKILNSLKDEWVESGFTLNKGELLSKI